ncbi:hypothetical protein JOB18_031240 [Solea senegalensis]|uniref:Uncharacterized protein n=1 Tax=Solea senegalensis TaxID=28829 RepID=A0AAV6PSP6_SOLSE|nr:hypothetical protein JOB18_031240 [Solea senegalensis]
MVAFKPLPRKHVSSHDRRGYTVKRDLSTVRSAAQRHVRMLHSWFFSDAVTQRSPARKHFQPIPAAPHETSTFAHKETKMKGHKNAC